MKCRLAVLMTPFIVSCALVGSSVASAQSAEQGHHKVYDEAHASVGVAASPAYGPMITGGFSIGFGEYLMGGLEASRIHLGNYGFGLGTHHEDSGILYPVSQSNVTNVAGVVSLDVLGKRNRGPSPFVQFGLGWMASSFITPALQAFGPVQAKPLPGATQDYDQTFFLWRVGGGFRIPLSRLAGLRLELNSFRPKVDPLTARLPSTSRFSNSYRAETVVQIGVGVSLLREEKRQPSPSPTPAPAPAPRRKYPF